MENQRDDLVVILAGCKELMDKFYESNPGLSYRIESHSDTPHYATGESSKIAKMILEEQQCQLAAESENALIDCINERKENPLLPNARLTKNDLDCV